MMTGTISITSLVIIILSIISSVSILLHIQISNKFDELKERVNDTCNRGTDTESSTRTHYDSISTGSDWREHDGRMIKSHEHQLQHQHVHNDNLQVRQTPVLTSARRLTRRRYLAVKGAVGDGITDDTKAIQRALNRAARNKIDAVVLLKRGIYHTTKALTIKGGVTLRGQGYGSSPLQIKFDAGGSVIAYCGEDYAIRIIGHAASVESLAVYDWRGPVDSECDNMKAKGGIIVLAAKRLVESVTMRNILIYWFMGGTALTLEAKNAGGIAYASMENIRVRHAKQGILLTAEEGSFVNSNAFHGGAISGGITDVGILATGPGACNDNQFQAMVIEPSRTNIAHVYVSGSKTNVRLIYVRLEGTSMMELRRPLVIVEDDSYGNVMNGMLGHTFVQADMNKNPGITFASNKMVGVQPTANNLFWNSAFHGFDANDQSIPGWKVSGSNIFDINLVSISEEEQLYPDHKIINITKGEGSVKLEPEHLPSSNAHSFCTFGIYAKSEIPNSISAAMKSQSDTTIASSSHTGSGKWEFIGLSSLFSQSTGPLAYFNIKGSVLLSAPTFTYGYGPARPGSSFMSSSGARMSGLLSMNLVDVSVPDEGPYWVLPREGNIFNIASLQEEDEPCSISYVYLSRINHSGKDRFDVGSTITLLFPLCGGCIPCLGLRHGSYIKLLGEANFAPLTAHSSITLVSKGSGVWSEISRNTL